MLREDRDYRLDHWDNQNFIHPSAREPILGLSPLDACAFCEWLTARDAVWSYRLPRRDEAPPDVACWGETEAGYAITAQVYVPITLRRLLLVLLYSGVLDLARARDLDRVLASAHASESLKVWAWTVGQFAFTLSSLVEGDRVVDTPQWLKNALSGVPGGWQGYLGALRTLTTAASNALHQEVDNRTLLGQLGNRERYRTLTEHLTEIDALRSALDDWYARFNGAQQPYEGLLLVRERKTQDEEAEETNQLYTLQW